MCECVVSALRAVGRLELCSVCGWMRFMDEIYGFGGLDWAMVRCIRFHVGASSSGFSQRLLLGALVRGSS